MKEIKRTETSLIAFGNGSKENRRVIPMFDISGFAFVALLASSTTLVCCFPAILVLDRRRGYGRESCISGPSTHLAKRAQGARIWRYRGVACPWRRRAMASPKATLSGRSAPGSKIACVCGGSARPFTSFLCSSFCWEPFLLLD